MRHLFALLFLASCTRPEPSASTPAPSPSAPPPALAAAPAPAPSPAPAPAPARAVYPWSPSSTDHLNARFAATPPGFARVDVEEGSFADFLRTLPLTPQGTKVVDYRGRPLYEDGKHWGIGAVVDIDVGERDLQHCADAVIRMHAEWRYGRGDRDIAYRSVSGASMAYGAWMKGDRAGILPKTGAHRDDHPFFRRYLDDVFDFASTVSLERDTTKVARMSDVRAGDFFVLPGGPGHAVLVLDVAKAPDGRLALLLGQSYMPAQSFSVLRNAKGSAWFVVEPNDFAVDTPFWKPFPKTSLHRFASSSKHATNDPCVGCAASIPTAVAKPPLLVVLHGDWGHKPDELVARWERFTAPRDVAVLAVQCPKEKGCDGSFWKWDGDPAWVTAQVDAFADKHPIDRDRLWLAGWSGGASWIGLRTQTFQQHFAAIVIHGGGQPPWSNTTCAAQKTPVFFLSGTNNPLREHANGLRSYYERCGDDVRFVSLAGADHDAEWKALDAHGDEIVEWLLSRRRTA